MRKNTLFFCLLFAISLLPGSISAQNVQMHYDFGRSLYDKDLSGRPLWTSTVEDFIPDKTGSTYFFIDMDYNNNGVASAYWEISHEFKFKKECPFSFHVEYNGGNVKNVAEDFNIRNAYLLGLTYTWNKRDYNAGFSFSTMYKYIQRQYYRSYNNFQLTATWYLNFAKQAMTFSGFADFWREQNDHGMSIFISEPQIWLNLNKLKGVNKNFNLSVGSETEFSYNFGGRNGFYAIPTLAVKWTFK